MRKRNAYADVLKRNKAALLACEQDSSLLDLLCEDGFLHPSELPEEESAATQIALLRRAIHRGFLLESCFIDEILDMLIVKGLDSLRIWTDLTDEDVHLRAPPQCA